jgi:transcriptional regulator with XRE-family HTH domain
MEGAMTTTHSESYPFVTKMINLFGDWLKQRRQLRELMQFEADPGELERIAHEFGVTPADLHMLVRRGSHGVEELPKILEALGIDEAAISRAQPALLRDMERVCAFCNHKRRCNQELAAGTASSNYVEYCGNADAIDVLRFKS